MKKRTQESAKKKGKSTKDEVKLVMKYCVILWFSSDVWKTSSMWWPEVNLWQKPNMDGIKTEVSQKENRKCSSVGKKMALPDLPRGHLRSHSQQDTLFMMRIVEYVFVIAIQQTSSSLFLYPPTVSPSKLCRQYFLWEPTLCLSVCFLFGINTEDNPLILKLGSCFSYLHMTKHR